MDITIGNSLIPFSDADADIASITELSGSLRELLFVFHRNVPDATCALRGAAAWLDTDSDRIT